MGALALVTEKTMTFGDWLKQTRKAKGITQKQLADAAGCTFQNVSGIENNADIGKDGLPSRPNVAYVDAWAKLLGVPVNEARRRAGHGEIMTSQEQEDKTILDYLRGASEPSREIMREVLRTIYEVDQRRTPAVESKPTAESQQEPEVKQASKWPQKPKNSRSAKR